MSKTDRLNELLTLCSDDLDDKISAHMGLDLSDPIHVALLLRIRCDKAVEEVGEAHAEIIAYEGSNPRKKGNGSRENIAAELLDEAFTSLLAFHHVTGQSPIDALDEHVTRKAKAYYGITVIRKPLDFDAIWDRYYVAAARRFEAGLTYDELKQVVLGGTDNG